MDFGLWSYIKIFLDAALVPLWWAWNLPFSLRRFFFLLILWIPAVPLRIWVRPAPVVVIKDCWTILWVNWWCLLAILACLTRLLKVALLLLSTIASVIHTALWTLVARALFTQQRFSFCSCPFPLLLMILQHHRLLLFKCLQHVLLLVQLLLLHKFDSLLNFSHFSLFYLVSHFLELFVELRVLA